MVRRSITVREMPPTEAGTNPRAASAVRLGTLIWDVSRLWRVMLDRTLKPLGVTRSQYSVVAFLSRRDGMTQTALAADLELTKVAVGTLLGRMEAAGFIERRGNRADARVLCVYLTRKGMRVIERIRELAGPLEAEIFQCVDARMLKTAITTLAATKGRLLQLDLAGSSKVSARSSGTANAMALKDWVN